VIVTGSRYMGQPVVSVATSFGTSSAIYGPPLSGPRGFFYYTVVSGDRFDLIASRLYGVSEYWWKIANANPEIFYPDDLVVGSIIRVPAV
jgi:nucleoid-associated protein YgaU